MKRPSTAAIAVAFATVYVVWGSTYLAIRFAIETMPPFAMAAVRFFTAGVLLYGWARWRGAVRPTASQWRSTAVIGACLLLGGNGLVVWAEQTVPSGIAALIVATVPLWIVALSWIGGKRPTGKVVLGLAIGMAGIGLLVGPSELGAPAAFDMFGVLALIAAAGSWSAGSLFATRADLPESSTLGTAMQMICGGLCLGLAAVIRRESFDLSEASAVSMAALGYLIVFGSIIGYSAYVWLLRYVDPAKVSTYAYVNPVVAVLLGWWLANEEFTARTLVAAGVIVAAVGLITTAKSAKGQPVRGSAGAETPSPDDLLEKGT